jgi:hypothetical protein
MPQERMQALMDWLRPQDAPRFVLLPRAEYTRCRRSGSCRTERRRPLSAQDEPQLQRAVSRWQIVGLSINDVIGSGIYLLPAATVALLGLQPVGRGRRRHRRGPAGAVLRAGRQLLR